MAENLKHRDACGFLIGSRRTGPSSGMPSAQKPKPESDFPFAVRSATFMKARSIFCWT